jgi:hypothetical protein
MKLRHLLIALALPVTLLSAQQPAPPPSQPVALTIYNQDFAVARTIVDLDLHSGLNEITTTQVTTQLEPDSVVLRDPSLPSASAKQPFRIPDFRILEQNYDSGVVNQQWLLEKYEGKTLNFQLGGFSFQDGHYNPGPTIPGKIIRAGGVNQNGPNGYQQTQPLIEVDGQILFQLPGTPLFPPNTDGLLLKPTLRWQISSEVSKKIAAELAYITGGFSWEATYNVVAPESTDVTGTEKADIVGWVTIHNQSGTEFPQARIKLMAGDVAKIQPMIQGRNRAQMVYANAMSVNVDSGQVTQKAFDDFHLYDLNRTVSLRDGEIKQVQFIEATGVTLKRSYLYNGAAENLQPWTQFNNSFIEQQNFGIASNTKVFILQEIKNSEANHLGIPLPAGRIRLYRRDSDGQMEFTGESAINHTPTEDTIKIATGSAFDVKGSRRQTDFHLNQSGRTLDETFEIKLTNQKPQPITVNVVEPLYRGENWKIQEKSADYTKLDSHTIQFPIQVPAKGESTLTYNVRYTW